MGRPRRYTPDEESQIAMLVSEHGPREAARRWTGKALDPATAYRIHKERGGRTTDPEKLAAEATARAAAPRAAEPQEPAEPGLGLKWRGKLLEGMAKKLGAALAAEQNPRVMASLNSALAQTLDRLEKHEQRAKPEQQLWQVVLYLPQKDAG